MPQQPPQIGDDVTALMAVSHTPEQAPSEHPHARTWRLVKENAPLVGGAIGAALTGGASLPLQMLAAGAGGAIGAGVRGDSMGDVVKEGAIGAGTQGAGGLLVKGGKAIASGLMRGTVPKTIAKNFDDVNIGQEMLDRGVVPGLAPSARRVSRLSTAANAEREAAAQVVPPMGRSKVIAGLRPLHGKAVAAREPEIASDVLEHMRESARNIGPKGMSGPEALARKDIKQALGKAATNAPNPRQAAMGPQLQDAERGAIVSHLRETPRMASALDESQALMAIDQVMKDAAHSNPVTRARIGGLTAASMSPIGLGATAHAVNQGSRALDPQVLRAMQIALLQGQE
jgi:hypothetical protein